MREGKIKCFLCSTWIWSCAWDWHWKKLTADLVDWMTAIMRLIKITNLEKWWNWTKLDRLPSNKLKKTADYLRRRWLPWTKPRHTQEAFGEQRFNVRYGALYCCEEQHNTSTVMKESSERWEKYYWPFSSSSADFKNTDRAIRCQVYYIRLLVLHVLGNYGWNSPWRYSILHVSSTVLIWQWHGSNTDRLCGSHWVHIEQRHWW